ncbi:hypothetical protein WwAna0654, partial [Wolbachia endosymbiont of Drosophila ananassae]
MHRFYAKVSLHDKRMTRLMQRLLQIIVKDRNLLVGHHFSERKNKHLIVLNALKDELTLANNSF